MNVLVQVKKKTQQILIPTCYWFVKSESAAEIILDKLSQ